MPADEIQVRPVDNHPPALMAQHAARLAEITTAQSHQRAYRWQWCWHRWYWAYASGVA
jgi:hypothetical protein